MNEWLSSVGAEAAVLVTVAIVDGSGPREAGAHMLVTAGRQFDTIGGGHLEMRAVDIGRSMLKSGQPVRMERFALGPSLGQCCGGVVHLAFDLVDSGLAEVLSTLRQRRGEDCWRLSAIDGPAASALFDATGALVAGTHATSAPDAMPPFARERGTHVMRDAAGRRWLVDACPAPRAHLLLFGAGHVGAALVRTLGELPCTVTWIDERDAMFPAIVPANVTVEASDTPEALVADAPPDSSYLVMTHSHALDQRLSEAILGRADVGWFGLIGSKTKRMQFEHRMRARSVPEERIAAMVCPIGLPGIANKAPAVIATSVCAQLLMVWEAQQAAATWPAAEQPAVREAPPLRAIRRTS